MNKKKVVVLDYGGQRILLDTIAGYVPIFTGRGRSENNDKYGIRFNLRTGEIVEHMGNDGVSRDRAIKYLDRYFQPDSFPINKCQVCAYKEDLKDSNCYSLHNNCSDYSGFKGFKRIENNA